MKSKTKKEFNFMINEELALLLKDYCEKRNIDCTKAINKILKIMLPLLKKHHFFSKEDNCRYRIIDAVGRIHCYIDKKIYRKLKAVHSDLNFYSIAILIRYLLKNFFILLAKKNNKVKGVKRMMERFNEKFKKRCEELNYEIEKIKGKKQLSRIPILQIAYTVGNHIQNIKILNPALVFH